MMVLKDNYNTLPVYYHKNIVIKKEKTGILPMAIKNSGQGMIFL